MRASEFPPAIFVTGTDTGIGKTVVSAMLTEGLNATYWKPIQSGLMDETDTEALQRMTSLPLTHFAPETYRLNAPLSPHASAEIDGVKIEMEKFRQPDVATDHLIVEGAGGLMVPLNDHHMMIDLAEQLAMPVLLVCRSVLGTLNHTFLSLQALRKRNIPVLGVIMNGPVNESNRLAIEKYGEIEVLAEIFPMDHITPMLIKKEFSTHFKN